MKQSKTVSIQKTIQTILGKSRAEKFLKGLDFTDMASLTSSDSDITSSSINIYQAALAKLVDGELEKAINYIIYGLDLDRESKLLFNLCKNLVFTLEKQLNNSNTDLIKNTVNIKNTDNLEKDRNSIRNKIKEMEKNISQENSKLEKLEMELFNSKPSFFSMNKLFITHHLKKKSLKPRISSLKSEIDSLNQELEQLKSDLKEIEKKFLLEEYQKVLGITMEVCIFPSRFQTKL
jgi:peptidoglycan hydrolase CwlO-like protein